MKSTKGKTFCFDLLISFWFLNENTKYLPLSTTLVSQLTDPVHLFFLRKQSQPICLIKDYCVLLKFLCMFIIFGLLYPAVRLLGTVVYSRVWTYSSIYLKVLRRSGTVRKPTGLTIANLNQNLYLWNFIWFIN